MQLSKFLKIRESSEFRSLIESHRNAIGGNREKAWPSGVVLNIMQIQTIAGCQCTQELESRSLTQAMFKLHARYISISIFKHDIRLENHLVIRTIAVTLRNLHTAGISRSQAAFSQLTFDRYCIAFEPVVLRTGQFAKVVFQRTVSSQLANVQDEFANSYMSVHKLYSLLL